jgi:hypothetical protein
MFGGLLIVCVSLRHQTNKTTHHVTAKQHPSFKGLPIRRSVFHEPLRRPNSNHISRNMPQTSNGFECRPQPQMERRRHIDRGVRDCSKNVRRSRVERHRHSKLGNVEQVIRTSNEPTPTHPATRRLFAVDVNNPRWHDEAPPRTNVANLPGHPSPVVRIGIGGNGPLLERNCQSVHMNMELDWRKRSVMVGPPSRRRQQTMWQCQVDGDVWTLSETARDIHGCKSWNVDRYCAGTRTRFASMPTLKSAAGVVVRFISNR